MLPSLRSFFASALLLVPSAFGQTPSAHKPKAVPFAKVPLTFEANQGQANASVRFLSHGSNYSVLLQPAQATLVFHREQGTTAQRRKAMLAGSSLPAKQEVVQMTLTGARADAPVTGERALPGYVNYMSGSNAAGFHTGIPTFGAARVHGAYAGVDLVYYGTERQLEYDFVVAPTADPAQIKLHFAGAQPVLSSDGGLRLQIGKTSSATDLSILRPVVYQQHEGQRETVDGSFEVAKNGDVSFHLGTYDHARELVIDPIISYASYFGGSLEDEVAGTTLNAANQLYAVGYTRSFDLPGSAGEYQASNLAGKNSNNHSAFVTKFSADGSTVLWTTYLAGSQDDLATSVAVNGSDQAYVTGYTASCGANNSIPGVAPNTAVQFPFTSDRVQSLCSPVGGPNNTEVNGGSYDVFLAKLSSDGKTLLYSTPLGGSANDIAQSVVLDAAGKVYLVGETESTQYQYFVSLRNNTDVPSYPIDNHGQADTGPSNYPTTANAFYSNVTESKQYATTDSNGDVLGPQDEQAFLTVLSADLHTITYSSLLGGGIIGGCGNGACNTNGLAIAVNGNGIVYIGGNTSSAHWPVTPGAFQGACSNAGQANSQCVMTGWAAGFNPNLSGAASLLFNTYITGSSAGMAQAGGNLLPGSDVYGMTTDSMGNVILTGDTNAVNFPTTAGVLQPTCPGHGDGGGDSGVCNDDAFLTKLTPTGATVWSTYLQGNVGSYGVLLGEGVAVDASNNVYMLAQGNAPGVPLINAISTNPSQSTDAYLAEFAPDASKLVFATYLGSGGGIAVNNNSLHLDSNLNAYFSGYQAPNTYGGTSFPITANAADKTLQGNADGFVVKMITQQQPSATALTVSPTGTVTSSQTVTLTATVSSASTQTGLPVPTGTVTFMNGMAVLGTAQTVNASGVATFAGTFPNGSYSFTAVYAGDSGFNGSTSSATAVTVSSSVATSTTLMVAPASASFGQSVTLTSTTLAGTTPVTSGSVSFNAGSVALGTATVGANGVATTTVTPAVGTYSVIASYTGTATTANPTGTGSSASAGSPLTVGKATPAVALTATPANASAGAAVNLSATVSGAGGTPSGSITFKDGSTVLGSAVPLAGGMASYSTSTLAVGTHTITATYSGDTDFTGLTSTAQTVTVTLGTVTVAFTATPTLAPTGSNVVLAATVALKTGTGTPGGMVTFLDGSSPVGSGMIANGGVSVTLSTLAAGTHTLTASYGGSTSFASATSGSVTVTVRAPAATTTTLTSSAASAGLASSVTFTANITSAATTGSPTGSVKFLDGSTLLGSGTVTSGAATFSTSTLAAGPHSITAIYSGDSLFLTSTSSAYSEVILMPALSIMATPNPLTIKRGQSGTMTLTLTPSGGFAGSVSFSCGTLPQYVSCVFNPTTLTFTSASGPATDTLTIDTAKTHASLTTPKFFGTSGGNGFALALLIGLPGSGLALLGLGRRKRLGTPLKRLAMLAFLLFGLGTLGMISGCGSSGSGTDALPGTYTIPLTITPSTGSAQTLNVSVVIQ